MTRPAASPEVTAPAVRWGAGQRAFDLHASDPDLVARAVTVFRPWLTTAPGAASHGWTVDRGGDSAWRVRPAAAPDGEWQDLLRGSVSRVVTLLEYRAVSTLVERPPDELTLHAALVARGDLGALIVGPNEAGKSTLACALWLAGFLLLGDDVAIVDPGECRAGSAPRRVSVRTPSRALLGDATWARILRAPATDETAEGCLFHPDEVDDRPRPRSVRIAACICLARRAARDLAGALPVRVPDAEQVFALVPYSNLIRRHELLSVVARLAPVVARVPMYDLPRGPLPAMVRAVDAIVRAHS